MKTFISNDQESNKKFLKNVKQTCTLESTPSSFSENKKVDVFVIFSDYVSQKLIEI